MDLCKYLFVNYQNPKLLLPLLRTLTKRNKTSKQNGSTTNLTLRFRKNRRVNSSDTTSTVYASNANLSQSQWYDTQTSNSAANSNAAESGSLFDHHHHHHRPSLDSFPEHSVTITSPSGANSSSTSQRASSSSRPNSGHYVSHHRASIQSHLSIYHYNPQQQQQQANSCSSSGVSTSTSMLSLAHSTSLTEGAGELGGDEDVPPPLPAKQSITAAAAAEAIPLLPAKNSRVELCKQAAIDDSNNNNNNNTISDNNIDNSDYGSFVKKPLEVITTTTNSTTANGSDC